MASTPKFASTPRAEYVAISTANTNRDGTGTLGSLITGVAAGTKVDRIMAIAGGTTTAGMLRFYLSLDGGTTNRLIFEMPVQALTPSASQVCWRDEMDMGQFLLRDASARLSVSTHNAETFYVHAFGGDLT